MRLKRRAKSRSLYERGYGYCSTCRMFIPAFEEICHKCRNKLRMSPRDKSGKQLTRITLETEDQ